MPQKSQNLSGKKIGWIQTNWNPKARGLKKNKSRSVSWSGHLNQETGKQWPFSLGTYFQTQINNYGKLLQLSLVAGFGRSSLWRAAAFANGGWDDVDGQCESAFRKFLEPIRPMISFVLGSVYSYGKKPLSAGWCFEILPFLLKSWLTTSENITKTKLRPFHTCLYGKVRTGATIQLCQGAGGRKAWLECCCIQPVEAGRTQCWHDMRCIS